MTAATSIVVSKDDATITCDRYGHGPADDVLAPVLVPTFAT